MAETSVLERTETSTKIRQKHKVVMYNDDTTSFEIVIFILMEVFGKEEVEAFGIAKAIHLAGPNGKKVVAEYSSLSLAKTKANQGMKIARDNGYEDFKIEAI